MMLAPVAPGKSISSVMVSFPKKSMIDSEVIRQVAVGVVFNAQQHVLMAKRNAGSPHAGLWEFPGGKFESGETGYVALCREIKEELHLDVTAAIPFMRFEYDYPQYTVLLDVWEITAYRGVACGAEGQVIRWFPLGALKDSRLYS